MRPDTFDLFEEPAHDLPLDDGAVLLGGFARPVDAELLGALADVVRDAPFRHMVTPGGWTMSVAMTNCGRCRLGDRPQWLPLRPDRSRDWPALAANAAHLQ